MTTYVVFRHGCNAANQSMTQEKPVLILEAASRDKACEAAAARVTCYANQHLSAKPASRVCVRDWEAAMDSTAELGQTEASYKDFS
jgi:hypothetical protein